MLDTVRINNLFNNVINWDINAYRIGIEDVENGIETLQWVYNKETTSLSSTMLNLADFNDPAHRIAYLHKYAALHTTMVRDMMYNAIQMNFNFFHEIVFSSSSFTMCCLGGGPGTDAIGILAALHQAFSYFPTSVTIADYMTDWEMSFISILRELGTGLYGAFGNNMSHFLNWSYLCSDLLETTLAPEVEDTLSNSNLVTMIKFASAAACKDTANMINNIFTAMKPGAVLFFIDNDAGGYNELIMQGACEHNFISIVGPIRHENYNNDDVKVKRFGYASCHQTTITLHILQKSVYFDYFNNPIVPFRPVLLERPDLLESHFANNVPLLQTPFSPTMPTYAPQLAPYQDFSRFDYSVDEDINSNAFISPSVAICQSPRSIKKAKLGCLSLKRRIHNLAQKVNSVKSLLLRQRRKKKIKKSNPVGRL